MPRQGQRLQAMLNFQQKYIYKTVAAQVIGSSGTDQSRVFYLDKGKDAGTEPRHGGHYRRTELLERCAKFFRIGAGAGHQRPDQRRGRDSGIHTDPRHPARQCGGTAADCGRNCGQSHQPGEKILTAGGDQIFPRGLPVGVVDKVVSRSGT